MNNNNLYDNLSPCETWLNKHRHSSDTSEFSKISSMMSSRNEFWETMKILVERDFKRNIHDDIEDWMENKTKKRTINIEEDGEDCAARKRKISECSGIDSELDEDVHKFLKTLEKKVGRVDYGYVEHF